MTAIPHADAQPRPVGCAIVTVSDTRTTETDRSGQLVRQLLEAAGHSVANYAILPDEPEQIRTHLAVLFGQAAVEAIILNGGTGIAPRDTTYDAIATLLEKELPGFGELFRWLSYAEIGSRAIASRAIAGVAHNRLIFSLPGSSAAVQLGLEQLILPELSHLVKLLHSESPRHE